MTVLVFDIPEKASRVPRKKAIKRVARREAS
jgi:hypothetical protein